ncbi:hypothetical protein [Sporomusa sphaeroides]|uniref:Uncharacterized protein n=1 Tax=uncultured Sporomusa sp. TaxID=307249 RepID=A0A212LXM7_9FIRM|nr:hypothetical protein [Sporomusa sphaeroides]SCM82354.1 conserved hypothetical protein [uncultured Sporomusa sp.]HML33797.1 hypothetical protein [Sporomusa sphaeroides]
MYKSREYKQKEIELSDKIRELSEEFDQLCKEKRDTTEVLQRLGIALEEFLLFRRNFKG